MGIFFSLCLTKPNDRFLTWPLQKQRKILINENIIDFFFYVQATWYLTLEVSKFLQLNTAHTSRHTHSCIICILNSINLFYINYPRHVVVHSCKMTKPKPTVFTILTLLFIQCWNSAFPTVLQHLHTFILKLPYISTINTLPSLF